MKTENVLCPKCGKGNVIKKGRRKTKFGFRQFYYCKDCESGFTDSKLPNKTYGPGVIVNAINFYNLGNTLEESAKHINRRFKVKVSKSSVHSWLNEFMDICTYHIIRDEVLTTYSKDVLVSKTYEHNGLNYNFKYHRGKTDILCKYPSLAEYVKGLERGCPEFFENDNRCSQRKITISFKKSDRYNLACMLAGFALKSARSNKERHSVVETFMLINDSSTIACEVPVWFWEKNLDVGICGHIDILQIRNGKIYILDFKPDAIRENENKVASQLYLYASGLSFRTGIPLINFRCAWFDEYNYFEFSPIDAKVSYSLEKAAKSSESCVQTRQRIPEENQGLTGKV